MGRPRKRGDGLSEGGAHNFCPKKGKCGVCEAWLFGMKRTGPAKAEISRDEWDFSSARVPEDEIETCYYYEYARARADIRKLVAHWKELLKDRCGAYERANTTQARLERGGWIDETLATKESAIRAFWSELAQLTDWTCAQLLINLPEFPDTPWQSFRPSRRAKWKHLLTFYNELERIRGGLREEPWNMVRPRLRYDFDNYVSMKHGELVAFRIDWQHGGVEKVIKDFNVWARKRYAALRSGGKKKQPRASRYEHLKQLGVWRLKEELGSWEVVQEHTFNVLGDDLYGQDDTFWRKARLAAIRRSKEMFPILRAH
jgi:hypothetical protein